MFIIILVSGLVLESFAYCALFFNVQTTCGDLWFLKVPLNPLHVLCALGHLGGDIIMPRMSTSVT